MQVRPVRCLLLPALALGLGLPLHAQQLYDFGAAFGRSAVVVGGDVLVGEPQATTRPGRIYVFRENRSGWAEAAVLQASDGARTDRFGRALATDGDRVAVGAPGASEGRGAVYLFQRTDGAWREAARLEGGADATSAGAAVALGGDILAFTERTADGTERVRVFRSGSGGAWTASGDLEGEAGDTRFGAALAALDDGAVAACGADAGGSVVVTVFRTDGSGAWQRSQRLSTDASFATGGGLLSIDPYLECGLASDGDVLALGTPLADEGVGYVTVYERDEEGRFARAALLRPFAPIPGLGLGMSVAVAGDAIWAGAPHARGMMGLAYRFERDDEGRWSHADALTGPGRDFMPVYGLAVAAGPEVAVVGSPGDDYGAGRAVVFRRGAAASATSGATSPSGPTAAPSRWSAAATLTVEGEGYDPVTGGRVECREGSAAVFGCDGMELVSLIPVQEMGASRGAMVNDVWGWTDLETGREYAVVGRSEGTSFVDVTDPERPVYLGDLPKTEGSRGNAWRDVKVIRDHALIVADNAGQHGMQIFDLTRLRDVTPGAPMTFDTDALYTGIASAHNLAVNEETGFAYTVGNSGGGQPCGSLHMIDMRDPKNPSFAGCYTDPSVGMGAAGSTHDAQCVLYRGPDERYEGREICFGFSETALTIGDVTDKEDPRVLAQGRYPNSAYVHQGWLTEDHRYLYINDELDEMNGLTERTRTLIWDVAELEDPVLVGEYLGETRATDHNLYVRGDLMYQSNYAAGLRLIDVSDPENPREVGFFDTAPYADDVPGFFDGSWSNYPFFESGNVLVTSHKQGLFVLRRSVPIS